MPHDNFKSVSFVFFDRCYATTTAEDSAFHAVRPKSQKITDKDVVAQVLGVHRRNPRVILIGADRGEPGGLGPDVEATTARE